MQGVSGHLCKLSHEERVAVMLLGHGHLRSIKKIEPELCRLSTRKRKKYCEVLPDRTSSLVSGCGDDDKAVETGQTSHLEENSCEGKGEKVVAKRKFSVEEKRYTKLPKTSKNEQLEKREKLQVEKTNSADLKAGMNTANVRNCKEEGIGLTSEVQKMDRAVLSDHKGVHQGALLDGAEVGGEAFATSNITPALAISGVTSTQDDDKQSVRRENSCCECLDPSYENNVASQKKEEEIIMHMMLGILRKPLRPAREDFLRRLQNLIVQYTGSEKNQEPKQVNSLAAALEADGGIDTVVGHAQGADLTRDVEEGSGTVSLDDVDGAPLDELQERNNDISSTQDAMPGLFMGSVSSTPHGSKQGRRTDDRSCKNGLRQNCDYDIKEEGRIIHMSLDSLKRPLKPAREQFIKRLRALVVQLIDLHVDLRSVPKQQIDRVKDILKNEFDTFPGNAWWTDKLSHLARDERSKAVQKIEQALELGVDPMKSRDKRFTSKQWEELMKYMNSEKFKAMREKNKGNRAKQVQVHHTGRAGYLGTYERLLKEKGSEPTATEIQIAAHTSKGYGKVPRGEVTTRFRISQDAGEIIAEPESPSAGPDSSSFNLGPIRKGRVPGFGMGVRVNMLTAKELGERSFSKGNNLLPFQETEILRQEREEKTRATSMEELYAQKIVEFSKLQERMEAMMNLMEQSRTGCMAAIPLAAHEVAPLPSKLNPIDAIFEDTHEG